MTRNVIVKGCAAILSSLVFQAGFWMLLGNVDLWGPGPTWATIVVSFLISLAGCLLLGWVNCRSIARALLGALVAMLVGIPLSYFLLASLAEILLEVIAPKTNLGLSGSFYGIWFLIPPVLLIELITDKAIRPMRWPKLFLGNVMSVVLLIGVEILTSGLGQTSQLSDARLTAYAPIVWGITVVATNYERKAPDESE